MALDVLAKKLAEAGRGNDTALVHIAPKELAGLQALAQQHGGSLTINPKTGLPEAGFLESILPMAIGVGSEFIMPGNPWGAAALGGGIGLLTSGGNLMKGLQYGLGAYGGQGLASNLMGAGASELARQKAIEAAAQVQPENMIAANTEADQLREALAQRAAQQAPGATPGEMPYFQGESVNPGTASPGDYSQMAAPERPLIKEAMEQQAQYQAPAATPSAADIRAASPWDSLKAGPQAAMQDPMKFGKDNLKYIGAAAAPYLMSSSGIGGLGAGTPGAAGTGGGTIRPSTFSQQVNPRFGMPGEPYFIQQYTPRPAYAAAAGGVVPAFAGGGITSLANTFAAGGKLLRGPGDGLSDDIPAVIQGNNPQQAALADGEFVVSADVVSGLGGGSTEAGAKKLYSMMDRVRKNAHGHTKQIKKVNDAKVLPA